MNALSMLGDVLTIIGHLGLALACLEPILTAWNGGQQR